MQMFRTSSIQKSVFDADDELVWLPVELAGERPLADIFDYTLSDPTPKLLR